jgi:hypothetical protein
MENARGSADVWDVSFNKSFITITGEYIRCGDSYHESNFIDVDPVAFKSLLIEWRKYVASPINEKRFQLLDSSILGQEGNK